MSALRKPLDAAPVGRRVDGQERCDECETFANLQLKGVITADDARTKKIYTTNVLACNTDCGTDTFPPASPERCLGPHHEVGRVPPKDAPPRLPDPCSWYRGDTRRSL